MTELEFGTRLKQLRQGKGLTQQELADQLGVSNKSVSRWESGGYPDVTMLVPLARILEVSVDELLSGERPLRSFGRSDWQNLMSYAFAIGGGVMFYLLDLFMPSFICYLLYLCMMAYGIYLQRHYTYHSHWFYGANALMDFFVNMSLMSIMIGGQVIAAAIVSVQGSGVEMPQDMVGRYFGILGSWVLASLILTGVTQWIIWRTAGEARVISGYVVRKDAFEKKKLLPVLGPLVLAGFWCLYCTEYPGYIWLYEHQMKLYLALWLVVTGLVMLYLAVVRKWWMMLPAGMVQLCCMGYALVSEKSRAYSLVSERFVESSPHLNAQAYVVFGQGDSSLLAITVLLMVLYLLCCCIKIQEKRF